MYEQPYQQPIPNKRYKKYLFILVAFILIVAVFVFIYFQFHKSVNSNSQNSTAPKNTKIISVKTTNNPVTHQQTVTTTYSNGEVRATVNGAPPPVKSSTNGNYTNSEQSPPPNTTPHTINKNVISPPATGV